MRTTTSPNFAGFQALSRELESAPKLDTAQQAKIKEAAQIIAKSVRNPELRGASFAELGVPQQLIPQATLELFHAMYPGLRKGDTQEGVAAFARALSNAKKIDPQGAAVAEFEAIMARDKRESSESQFPKNMRFASATKVVDRYRGGFYNSIEFEGDGIRGPLKLDIHERPDSDHLHLGYQSGSASMGSSGHWDWEGLSDASIQHFVDCIDAFLEADALAIAKGGQGDSVSSYLRDHLKPRLIETKPSVKLAKVHDAVAAKLEGVAPPVTETDTVRDAVKETMPDGATVGRLKESGALKRLVNAIFH